MHVRITASGSACPRAGERCCYSATYPADDIALWPKEFISFVDASEERGGYRQNRNIIALLPQQSANGIQHVVGEEVVNGAEAP
jgi:hypothetical protein